MKLSEKVEEALAIVEKPLQTKRQAAFCRLRKKRGKSRKMLEKGRPFFPLLPTTSESNCGKCLCKIAWFLAASADVPGFFRFFPQLYGFTGWPVPSQRE
jgi:hypothetical protein